MFPAALLQIIIVLLIAGVALWALTQFPALDATIRQLIRVVIIAVVAIWLIYVLFGLMGTGYPVFPRTR